MAAVSGGGFVRDGVWRVVFDALAGADRHGLDLVNAADVVYEAVVRELEDGRVASRVRALHFSHRGGVAGHDTCAHCDHLAGSPIAYPCDTVQMLLRDGPEQSAAVVVLGLWFARHGARLPDSATEALGPQFSSTWPEPEPDVAAAWYGRAAVPDVPELSVVADVVLQGVPARLVLPRVLFRVTSGGGPFAMWMFRPEDAERVLARGGLFPLPVPGVPDGT